MEKYIVVIMKELASMEWLQFNNGYNVVVMYIFKDMQRLGNDGAALPDEVMDWQAECSSAGII